MKDLKKSTPEETQQMLQMFNKLITENEALRLALETQKAQTSFLMTITDNMIDLVALTDMEGNFTFAGKSHELIGYDPDYLVGKNVMEFVHPEDLPHVATEFSSFIASGDSGTAEYRCRCKDGLYMWVETVGKILKDENGHPQEIVFCTRDVTMRKQAQEAIVENKNLLEGIINGIPDILAIQRPDHTVERYNQAGYDAIGLTPEAAKNRKCYQLIGRESECDLCATREALRTKKLAELEKYVPELDQYLNCRSNPILDKDGNVIHIIEQLRDITDCKRAEKERAELQVQLQHSQKMESVGRLAGGVAHDFNNMLTIINGYAEMMTDVLSPSDPMHESAREIYDAGKRSAVIVRKLLAFARKQTIEPVPMNLNDSVSGMLKMLQRLIGENIDLIWKPGKDLRLVKLDLSQVDQILANLVVNAHDAIADIGKITIETVNIDFDENYCATRPGFVSGQFVMLAVSDNGCGMDKVVLDNLFEPFFTTKEIGKGTGLGLPMVYGIVKQNNGFVSVYSEPGQGTTVKMYFPRYIDGATGLDVPGLNGSGRVSALCL